MALITAGHLQGDTRVDVLEAGSHVEVVGRLDSRSAHEVRRAIDDAIACGVGDLVIDVRLAEVHDSTGLGVLLGAHVRARHAGRRLLVAHPSPRLARLVRAAHLGRALHLQLD